MISIYRFLTIVKPCQPASNISHRCALLMIAVAWLWSLFCCSPPFYGFGEFLYSQSRYIPDGIQTSCSFDYIADNVEGNVHVAGMYICELLISIGIILFCYIQIV
ncbi:unnamed protein product, partial [Dibothriocephalus latus]